MLAGNADLAMVGWGVHWRVCGREVLGGGVGWDREGSSNGAVRIAIRINNSECRDSHMPLTVFNARMAQDIKRHC